MFSSTPYDVSSRPSSTAVTNWNMPAWNTVGETHQSPDISALVQEIVDRAGWQQGNNMAFVVSATGDRTAESWEGSDTEATLLHIEYLPPPVVVAMDIAPGDGTNYVNTLAAAGSTIDVAVIGDPEFNVADIDPASLRFGPGSAAVPVASLPGVIGDTGSDSIDDLLIPFRIDESGISCEYTEDVVLTGSTTDGTLFEASEFVTTPECETSCHP